MSTIDLDVRQMPPRDRHRTIFDQLASLASGETLTLTNDHDPIPLRYQLDAEHPDQFRWEYKESGPETWVVDITSRAVKFDARPILAQGGEPFEAIMEAISTVGDDEIFVLYAPFEPAPLEPVLKEKGFRYVPDRIDDSTWRATFLRA